MVKQVTFYPNHDDNLHCMLAVYQSIIDYFYDEKLSWEEIEDLTGFEHQKAAWSLTIVSHLAKRGMKIRMVEPFDYSRYFKIGAPYLDEVFSPVEKEWQLKNSNILEIRPLIPDFLATVKYNMKRPTLSDIDSMLDDNMLVFVTLNSQILNDKAGYSSHAVLVLEADSEEYIIHDPGLPPQAYRKISKQKLFEAMGGKKATSEVTGFKL